MPVVEAEDGCGVGTRLEGQLPEVEERDVEGLSGVRAEDDERGAEEAEREGG